MLSNAPKTVEGVILVVDDAPANLYLLCELLSAEGYEVQEAPNGQLALELVNSAPPDLILLDINMPQIDGYEVCRQLKANASTREIPIIFISVLDEAFDKVKAFEVGGVDYLTKPFQVEEVLARVKHQLTLQKQQKQITEQNLRLQQEIRARRTAEAALRESVKEATRSAAELRALFAAMTDVVLIVDAAGECLKIAPTNPVNLYKPPAQMLGKTLHEIFPPDLADIFLCYIWQALSTQQAVKVEYGLTIEEQKKWFTGSVSPISEDSVIWITRDITERIAVEGKLRESEERFRATFEQAAVGISHVGLDGCFRRVNQKYGDILGYTREEVLSKSWSETTYPEDLEAERHYIHELLSGARNTFSLEKRCLGKNGLIVWVNHTVSLLRTPEGEPKYMLGVIQDISNRKYAEELLNNQRRRLSLLIEKSPIAIIEWSPLWQVLAWNPAAAAMFGYSEQEAINRHLEEFIAPESAIKEDAEANVAQFLPISGGTRAVQENLTKNGQTIICEWHNAPLVNATGEILGVVSMVVDITERQKVQQEQARLLAILEATTDLIGTADINGQMLYANRAGRSLLRLSEEQNLTGVNLTCCYTDWAKEILLSEALPEATCSGVWIGETALLNAESKEVPLSQMVLAHKSPDGEVEYFSTIARDISDRKRAEAVLRAEQEKSERLLRSILPQSIANRLKQDTSFIAEQFDQVTILFADIVGFTPLAARMPPKKLVNLLNEIFSTFDQLANKYGLEKIKTIGDAYIVAGGLPVVREDHATAIAEMALEIQAAITRFSTDLGKPFQIRIGINTGPVVAGVIGVAKLSYDLWGDTVNVASRMESTGMPGGIQVTASTYAHLQEKYCFRERGTIAVKGKGKMLTYWLKGRKVPSPTPSFAKLLPRR